jgi:hypothetical protein
MRLVRALSILFPICLALSVESSAKTATGYPQSPRCPSRGTKEVWKKNFDGCMKPFLEDKDSKAFQIKDAEAVCKCGADGIVNSWTCEEMKRYNDAPPEEQRRLLAPIVATCSKYLVKKR